MISKSLSNIKDRARTQNIITYDASNFYFCKYLISLVVYDGERMRLCLSNYSMDIGKYEK